MKSVTSVLESRGLSSLNFRVPTVMEKNGTESCHGKSWKMGEKNKVMEIQKGPLLISKHV